MKPRRILLPGGITWLMSCLLFTLPQHSDAQCSGTIQSVTYTTTMHGSGSDTYTPSLQQYNPPPGYSLISATIDSYVTATASISYHNTGASTLTFFPEFARTDLLNFNGTDIAIGHSSFFYPKVILTAGATKNVPSQNVFNNKNVFEYMIDNTDPVGLADYQGAGNVTFTYQSTSFLNSVPTAANPVTTSVDDITFSITYSFCNPTLLATKIISFTATRESKQAVRLAWISTNEEPGDQYELEAATDGRAFTSFATVKADAVNNEASYTYSYSIPAGAKGKLYFRLKSVNIDGTASFTGIRIVDLGKDEGPGFSIYPNPPSDTYVNLVFGTAGTDWQVELVAANGSLLQKAHYHNTATTRWNFLNRLAAGAYFVHATDIHSGESYVRSFVLR